MKRRVVTLGVLAIAAFALYYFGGKYLWPRPDVNTIRTVGIIEAPEVNLTSRIAGRITQLDLLEGDHVQRDQIVCRIEDVDVRNQLAKAQGDL
jgi:multidrug efflux pump subunit AcrA (membrane-fusion protein)